MFCDALEFPLGNVAAQPEPRKSPGLYVDLSMIRQDGTQRLIEILSDHDADEILKGDWICYILPKSSSQSQPR